jgi:diguanylate cyclase (GGDEF)-like protein
MTHDDLSSLRRLHGFLEVTRLVRSEDDLPTLLRATASAIAESLGFGVVAIHLYRPAYDDFQVSVVHGPPRAQELLGGDTRDWSVWGKLLDDRFLRGGVYFIPHGEFDWETFAPGSYRPGIEAGSDSQAWHPEDALIVPLRHSDGHLLGMLSVDEPATGQVPSGEELDILTAMADHAALAIQGAQEAARATRHQAALERLLAVSSRLTETFSIDAILESVCEAIASSLGFASVAVDLLDPATGRLHVRATYGWSIDDPRVNTNHAPDDLRPLLDERFEIEGCYLLTPDQAAERFPVDERVYVSTLSGRGPHAWADHWLMVPLWSRDGDLVGVVAVDDPVDRLLPSSQKLQALRIFANQATAALDAAIQYEEMQFLAEHDPLTRLFNRRAFNERLAAEVSRSLRYGHPVTLALCDLDGFKALNDSLGHAAGDAALEWVGGVFHAALRAGDAAFRIGGDEFALLLPETDRAEADPVILRVTEALHAEPGTERLGASFGIAVCPADGADPQLLFRAADAAMYATKPAPANPRMPRAS